MKSPMIKIFDDIIDKPLQEEIKLTLLRSSGDFPWFFLDDVTSSVSSDTQLRPAFFHLFCDNFQDNSYFYSMTKPDTKKGKVSYNTRYIPSIPDKSQKAEEKMDHQYRRGSTARCITHWYYGQ